MTSQFKPTELNQFQKDLFELFPDCLEKANLNIIRVNKEATEQRNEKFDLTDVEQCLQEFDDFLNNMISKHSTTSIECLAKKMQVVSNCLSVTVCATAYRKKAKESAVDVLVNNPLLLLYLLTSSKETATKTIQASLSMLTEKLRTRINK